MAEPSFPRLVSLACHDLRTPLATVNGFAKTLLATSDLGERDTRFLGMIDEAAGQLAGLIDQLGLAARIAAGRYEPALTRADPVDLAASGDPRVTVTGHGDPVETDIVVVRMSLAALANAAARHGPVDEVTWAVAGRELELTALTDDAAPVVSGASPRDLGALVARMALEALGGSLAVEGAALRVRL